MLHLPRLGVILALICSSACVTTAPANNFAGPASPESPDMRAAIMSRYSYFELYSALELLDHVINFNNLAEGESAIGCRIEIKQAQAWLPSLLGMVDEAAARERLVYLDSQQKFQRSRGFDRCSPTCTCAALTKIINPVPLRSFKSQEARAAHRENLRKLSAKTLRMNDDAHRACSERWNWFCSSELREYFEIESARQRP